MSNGDLSVDIVLINHFLLKPWELVFIYIKYNIFNWPCLPSLTSKSHYQVGILFKTDVASCTMCLIFSFQCLLKLVILPLTCRKTKEKMNKQNMFFILLVWDRGSIYNTGWTQSLHSSNFIIHILRLQVHSTTLSHRNCSWF